jgi:hypothetical protein
MAMTFPVSPTAGDEYTVGGRTWTWDGTVWSIQATILGEFSVDTSEIANGAVTTAKIASSAITTGLIADGTIVNADIDAAAAIATTKITGWEDDQIVLNNRIFN